MGNIKEVNKVAQLEIKPSVPFDFDSTFYKPDHFPSNDNLWEHGIRWQTMLWNGKELGLKFIDSGSTIHPKVKVDVFCKEDLQSDYLELLKHEITYRFNLDLDLTNFYLEFENDSALKEPIAKFKGMRPAHAGSLYEYLIIGIVLQNTFVKRSVQMLQALFENYGTLLKFDNKELWIYWKPGSLDKVTEEDLRKLKLGYRAKSIKKLDYAFGENLIDESFLRNCNMETQKDELLKLYGVGPATVWYILFDVFHQYDFFNHISPWEQKIYSKLFFDRDAEDPVKIDKLIKYFDKFGKYRQLAVHYIWEDLWWKRKNESVPWLEKLIRL